MNERPILFSAPMVRAILAETKTQTRRVVKQQPVYDGRFAGGWKMAGNNGHEAATCSPLIAELCPYGQPGDRLWVRESFCPIYPQDPSYNGGRPIEYDYQATYKHGDRLGDLIGIQKKWKPSIHMPRAVSRITLEITGVRVERLQDISEADAISEGIEEGVPATGTDVRIWKNYSHSKQRTPWLVCPLNSYFSLWESINGPGSWEANPWVWVVGFKRLKGGAA